MTIITKKYVKKIKKQSLSKYSCISAYQYNFDDHNIVYATTICIVKNYKYIVRKNYN